MKLEHWEQELSSLHTVIETGITVGKIHDDIIHELYFKIFILSREGLGSHKRRHPFMHTLFREPKNVNEARRQANILARAKTLFSSGGYSWYVATPLLFGVCGPKGQHYCIDVQANTCSCAGFPQDGDCKHRIAVANSENCRNASLCLQAEQAANPVEEFGKVALFADRAEREIRELGFTAF